MTTGYDGMSQQKAARIAGIAYLVVIAAGIFAEFFVRSGLIEPGDAAATARNITGSETLFRVGLAADLLMLISDVLVALALYVLLKPVDAGLALLAAFFRLVMSSILGINLLNQFAVLLFLGDGGNYLSAFDTEQLQALALLSLRAHATGYDIGLVFFGVALLVLGNLLFRSGYVPRLLALLLCLGAVVYLTGSFTGILAPAYQSLMAPAYMLPFVAELALALWLAAKGVRLPVPGAGQTDTAPAR